MPAHIPSSSGTARAAAARLAWKERELAKARPLTQAQQAELRRLLLPASPVPGPSYSVSAR